MKFSIITPTNDPQFLNELKSSIYAQTYKDWEWIIVPNNGTKLKLITSKKIKIIPFPEKEVHNIGEIKNFAFSQGTGDILVEVDHDDILTPDCLTELAKAFTNTDIGFVYSDNAKLGNFVPYNPAYGWTWGTFDWKGLKLTTMFSQPLTPGRLGYIWYAPDHIRAWRKTVYNEIGGHNPELSVCDDLDLMHRTYLKTNFAYIPKVLYIYRIREDNNNSWLKRNAEIQSKTVDIYKQNIYALAERFAEINGLEKIDLCGGFNCPKGYTPMDTHIEIGVGIRTDLNKPWPLENNSVGVIRAHDALEHLVDKQFTMSEIHRVLAPGGMLLSQTPSTDGRGAWQDPTHVAFWNQNSFWYYTREEQMKYIHNDSIKFRECYLNTEFPNDWAKNNNIPYVIAHLEKL